MNFVLPNIFDQKSKIGFYFHIPFCPHICPYCDFVKTAQFTHKDIDSYFLLIEEQLLFFINKYDLNKYKTATVYFGGGTPGIIPEKYYEKTLNIIFEYFECEEITIETNPFTNYKNRLFAYKKIGINRLTLGIQSLCDETLKFLGRKHNSKTALDNILWAREAGFEQIQADLIYGLKPGIRKIKVEDEIKSLIAAGATGVSCYGLTIENRTAFSGTDYSNDDVAANEYESIINSCKSFGLNQVETSNFSFYPAKHNNLYWHGYPYIGVGTGAHGLLPPHKDNPCGIRYSIGEKSLAAKDGDDKLKFSDSTSCEKNFKINFEPVRSKEQALEEMIFTVLRTSRGVSLDWLNEYIYGENTDQQKNDFILKIKSSNKIARALSENKIIILNNYFILSQEEKIRGDAWALELIYSIQDVTKG